MKKWTGVFFLFFFVYNTRAGRISMSREMVIAQLPATEISLACRYLVENTSEVYNLRWERGKKDGPLVLEVTSLKKTICGEGFKNRVRLVDNCTLIINHVTPDLAGKYAVTIHTQSGTEMSSETELVVAKEDSYIYSNAVTLAAVTTLSVKIPTMQVILPCNYTLGKRDNYVSIEWRYGQPNGSLVLHYSIGKIASGSNYTGRVGMGHGCSLIISNPQTLDSGAYEVSIRSSNIHLPEATASVYLKTIVEDENICIYACTITSMILLAVVMLVLVVLGIGMFYVWLKTKRSRDDGDNETNSSFTSSQRNTDSARSRTKLPDNGKVNENSSLRGEDGDVYIDGHTSVNVGHGGRYRTSFVREMSVGMRHRINTREGLSDVVESGASGRLRKDDNDHSVAQVPNSDRIPQPSRQPSSSPVKVDRIEAVEEPKRSEEDVHSDQNSHASVETFTPDNCAQDQDNKIQVAVVNPADSGFAGGSIWFESDRSSEISRQLTTSSRQDKEFHLNLHAAVRNGDLQMCCRVLEMGCDVNELYDGETPLHRAVYKKEEYIVELLLEWHAYSNLLDKNGQTALQIAAGGGHKITKLLLKAGVDKDFQSLDGYTALMCAAEVGHKDVVALLVKKGARVDLLNNDQNTCLILAALKGHTEVCKVLITAGDSINHQNQDGNTALHLASRMGNTRITDLLLKAGAQLNILNTKGETALSLAMESKKEELIQLLQESEIW